MEDIEDNSQQLDLTQWDYNDLDFRTPQPPGINSRGVTSFTSLSPSPSGQRPRLPLLQLDDWDPDSAYDESPPTCIHYSIEWKLQLDVPPYILDMIYEKERLDGERRAKRKASSLESDRPIKIVNVLPSPYGHPTAEGYTPPSSNLGCILPSVVDLTDLVIPKPIDRAVDDYTEWLCDQVEDERWKAGFRSAGSITKANCLNLRHVYQDRNIEYYVDQGMKAGIARSFVQDIKMWADSL
ncbi:hypothetical protein BKA59DRAFT_550035 [Fusarium tricinctum]|uniref:Uncharacterized protein n=1 Tax=Fusarium tricinctum TaxID=61284 RepID=A0A8K0RM98_9HYPO|nr:hypothetical protein BKA59DRAFT_550035 [Fusarium tricinctum]